MNKKGQENARAIYLETCNASANFTSDRLGIKALENYKKEWNDLHGCWSSHPLHNFASHGADALVK